MNAPSRWLRPFGILLVLAWRIRYTGRSLRELDVGRRAAVHSTTVDLVHPEWIDDDAAGSSSSHDRSDRITGELSCTRRTPRSTYTPPSTTPGAQRHPLLHSEARSISRGCLVAGSTIFAQWSSGVVRLVDRCCTVSPDPRLVTCRCAEARRARALLGNSSMIELIAASRCRPWCSSVAEPCRRVWIDRQSDLAGTAPARRRDLIRSPRTLNSAISSADHTSCAVRRTSSVLVDRLPLVRASQRRRAVGKHLVAGRPTAITASRRRPRRHPTSRDGIAGPQLAHRAPTVRIGTWSRAPVPSPRAWRRGRRGVRRARAWSRARTHRGGG